MNRKIYFGDKYLEFTDNFSQKTSTDSIFYLRDQAGNETLKTVAHQITDTNEKKNIVLQGFNFHKALDDLKVHFHYIEAAGGLIQRDHQWLFIRRHDRWDLPKGKLNKKETVKDAAVRECEEECGVQQLQIIKSLAPTFHIYPYKGKFALKQTFWFYMTTDYTGELKPQLEEDITDVKWFTADEAYQKVLVDTYYTIADVVKDGIRKNN